MENKWEKSKELNNEKFKRLIGVKRNTFDKMTKILSVDYAFKHENGGRNAKLSVENQLMLAIEYWRQYPTYEELGFNYGIAQSTAHEIVEWIENVLIRSGKFSLKGKRSLLEDSGIQTVLVDVMESPIERPKKNRKNTIQEKRRNTP